jgi:hypothetical protein
MKSHLIGTFEAFENDFAPVPVENTLVKDIFIGLFTLGLGAVGGKAFDVALKSLPEITSSKVKAIGENILSTGIDAAIGNAKTHPAWTADDQSAFLRTSISNIYFSLNHTPYAKSNASLVAKTMYSSYEQHDMGLAKCYRAWAVENVCRR